MNARASSLFRPRWTIAATSTSAYGVTKTGWPAVADFSPVSQAFAACQVQKVFQAICLRPPGNAADQAAAAQITSDFQSSGYNMKQVFAETAVYCMGT